MDNLNKTQVIVDDIKKKLSKIQKADDPRVISALERECVKAAQIAHMQFAYITRDIYNVVTRRRTELRTASYQTRAQKDVEETPKKDQKNVETAPKKSRKAKKTTKKGE